MQYLERIGQKPEASWYRLSGDYQGNVNRWVVSTPQTIKVCNSPELCGVEFSDTMRDGVTAALKSAPFLPFLKSVPSGQLCIMNFLRGSLNFDLRHVLYEALGSNYHPTCFMSSQRFRQEGRWHVKEDMYRKIRIPDGAILLVGDVVATGVTVDNGLDVILNYLIEHKFKASGLVFLTMGCHKLEKILEKYHAKLKELFPEYRETHIVYFEGKFRLVNSSTKLVIAIPGTDLVKTDAIMAPEFERSQYHSLGSPLERCIIYDAGSRAFDVREYIEDVVEYWEQVRRLSRRGYTLLEALKERLPEIDYGSKDSLMEARKAQWQGVEDKFIEDLWGDFQNRWTPEFKSFASTREALGTVCDDRLAILERIATNFARGNPEDD